MDDLCYRLCSNCPEGDSANCQEGNSACSFCAEPLIWLALHLSYDPCFAWQCVVLDPEMHWQCYCLAPEELDHDGTFFEKQCSGYNLALVHHAASESVACSHENVWSNALFLFCSD